MQAMLQTFGQKGAALQKKKEKKKRVNRGDPFTCHQIRSERVDKPQVCRFQMRRNRYGCCRFSHSAEMKL